MENTISRMESIATGAKMGAMGRMAAAFAVAGALAASAWADGETDVKFSPMKFGAVHEFGMFERGATYKDVKEFTDEWMDHFGAYFTQEAVVNGNLALKAGLGGVFMFPKPEDPDEEFGGSQFKAFYVGPTVAEAMYHFGGVEGSKFSLGGGMFAYKYNPDASNLGEYLFRSIPYPTVIQTGGLTAIGGNAAVLQALRASFRAGGLSFDAILATETNMPPLYNGSLGLVAGYSIADGLVDIGAGVNFKNLLQVRPSRTTLKDRENSEFNVRGTWYAGEERYYRMPADFMTARYDAIMADSAITDKKDTALYSARHDLIRIADLVKKDTSQGGWRLPGTTDWVDSSQSYVEDGVTKYRSAKEEHYSAAGTLVMGRISIDLKKLFPSDRLSPQDFRIYAEAAILGLKNYNMYYKDITERMPIMAGVNIPTWGLLDLLAVQVEKFDSPWANNTYPIGNKNWSIPFLPEALDAVHSRDAYNDLTLEDNLAWSILARKRLVKTFDISAQVARDHHRTFANSWFYGNRFDAGEMTHRGPGFFDFEKSSWYWMLQFGWNI